MVGVRFTEPTEFLREANAAQPKLIRVTMGSRPVAGGSPLMACFLLAGFVNEDGHLVDLNYFCGTGFIESEADGVQARLKQAFDQLRTALAKDLPECVLRAGYFRLGGARDET